MARRPTTVKICHQTYTIGDIVHYKVPGLGTVENVLCRIIKHRNECGYTFIMMDGDEVYDTCMIESCGPSLSPLS